MADCKGPCNTRYRRAQDAYKKAKAAYDPLDPDTSPPDQPRIRPMDGNPWCLECAWQIRLQFSRLDRLASLRAVLSDGYPSDASAERVSGSNEAASPSPAADDVADITRVLADWEWAYRRLKGWPAAERYGDLADQRTECIAWLSERLEAILSSPLALDFGTEVMEQYADLCAKAKAGPPRTLRKPLRCPQCRLLMLCYTDGDRDVKCCTPYCNFMLPLDAYEAEVERQATAISRAALR